MVFKRQGVCVLRSCVVVLSCCMLSCCGLNTSSFGARGVRNQQDTFNRYKISKNNIKRMCLSR